MACEGPPIWRTLDPNFRPSFTCEGQHSVVSGTCSERPKSACRRASKNGVGYSRKPHRTSRGCWSGSVQCEPSIPRWQCERRWCGLRACEQNDQHNSPLTQNKCFGRSLAMAFKALWSRSVLPPTNQHTNRRNFTPTTPSKSVGLWTAPSPLKVLSESNGNASTPTASRAFLL